MKEKVFTGFKIGGLLLAGAGMILDSLKAKYEREQLKEEILEELRNDANSEVKAEQ